MANTLFVYGTLAPGKPNEHVLAPLDGTWKPATVRGQLYEEGWGAALGYPGIILDSLVSEVNGLLFSSEKLEQFWTELDEFEGAGYQRVSTQVRLESGEYEEAQIYVLSEEP